MTQRQRRFQSLLFQPPCVHTQDMVVKQLTPEDVSGSDWDTFCGRQETAAAEKQKQATVTVRRLTRRTGRAGVRV
ncbi:hypothetical protein PoB_004616400 [Plakobranchus ocellatus]|uniref:Uncharacterized protein n=1 Tax=Plakobranchus ocellatus TaxID=259542 RepID=A0AAV4BL38_9GAST|nr:hypothetical protein PoB_004616400 [Plakobranchus ocellatus]